MREFASQSIDFEVAIRKDGKLLNYRRGFYSEKEADTWAQNNMTFETGCRYEIIAVTRRIIKCRRV